MGADKASYDRALARAAEHASTWLGSLAVRQIGPSVTADELVVRFGEALRHAPAPPEDVVDELAQLAEDGLMAIPSGRFFGWVMGGTLPAALSADWLVSAWDQNAGMRYATPAVVAAEEAAAAWLLELWDLPRGADVGFVTGATTGNFTCLAAARHVVLRNAGWEVERDGLSGSPRVRVLAGAEGHPSVDIALRYLGLGAPERVAADDQGKIRVDALIDTLAAGSDGGPVIVCLQAGNLHSGAFDPMVDAIEVAHAHGAWVHVDGAFGLWAAAAPSLRHLTVGMSGADSWATDAHKTLNVPYDSGMAIVADAAALRAALGVQASYFITDGSRADPFDRTPEMSRRARGVPVWAALRSLGRQGVADMVEGLARNARAFAAALTDIDGAVVLNDVVYTQLCVAFGDDDRTRAITDFVIADGATWMSGSRWRGQQVLRISVSNWSTDDDDIERSVDAISRAVAAAG